jgi:hypothetical protein
MSVQKQNSIIRNAIKKDALSNGYFEMSRAARIAYDMLIALGDRPECAADYSSYLAHQVYFKLNKTSIPCA